MEPKNNETITACMDGANTYEDFSETLKNSLVMSMTELPNTSVSLEFVEEFVKDSVSPEVKNKLAISNDNIYAFLYDDGMSYARKKIMPDIKDVRVIADGKVVFVDFKDGTTEKAVLSSEDTYSLEQGISVCITKKLLSNMTNGNGSSVYNKIIDRAVKVMKNNRKAEKKAAEKAAEDKARAEKIAAKKKAKRIAAEQRKFDDAVESCKYLIEKVLLDIGLIEEVDNESEENTAE